MLKTLKQKLKKVIRKQKQKALLTSLPYSKQTIRLDLGCGSCKREGFIGIDLSPEADIQWDISNGLPFPDNSVSEIRSDHFFEHLELPVVVNTFRECHRVLLPDGILDFTVPHVDAYIDAYLKKDYQFLQEKINDIPEGQEDLYNTCFDRIAWLLHRGGEHKSLFDQESLVAKLKLAGFQKISIRQFDPKRDINARFSSIYVEAAK
jgi:predicted SAM-dependent methyltransferase